MAFSYPKKCFIVSKTLLLKKKVGEESLWEAFFSAWGKEIFDPVIKKIGFSFSAVQLRYYRVSKSHLSVLFYLKKKKYVDRYSD